MIYKNRYFRRSNALKSVSPGRFEVGHERGTYRIEGGTKLGGSRREWMLEGPEIEKSICCTSVIDALRLLDNL